MPEIEGFEDVVGHDRPLAILDRMVTTGRIPTGLLFHGERGRGKKLVARRLMARLFEDGHRQLANHPDVDVVRAPEGKRAIPIERLRELRRWFSRAPLENDRRAALIEDADRLGIEAQNSLLKLLEEPPRHGLLILTTSEPARLLETIHSRAQAVHFGPVMGARASELVAREAGVDRERAEDALRWSGGSPGRAMMLAREGGEGGLTEAVEKLLDPRQAPFGFAEEFFAHPDRRAPAAARDEAVALLDWALQSLIPSELLRRDENFGPKQWRAETAENVVQLILEARGRIEGNVACRLVIEALKIEIARSIKRDLQARRASTYEA